MFVSKPILAKYALRTFALSLSLLIGLGLNTPAHAAGLNDTGQTTCYDETQAVTPEPSTHPRQDCTIGRDAAAAAGALTKVGGGRAGFDYTKIANDGRELPANAVLGSGPGDWACTRDNVTGILWEVKTDDDGLRDRDWRYTWYDDIHIDNNGGNPGSLGSNTCGGTLPNNQCNTQAYTAAVNAAGLCGFTDWRLPTKKELLQLVDVEIPSPGPTIESVYFPNTRSSWYWSSSTYAHYPDNACYVGFYPGFVDAYSKARYNHVRLARGGQ
ncbi:MAG: DUF1566 domain-containing protein [Gammaproteobacteria bacterium]|nr:DUF1566 domain-containing protein [Gammaproteobacteria bacterium]HRX71242.1 DUF1566 domain-containing protein [Candidatus Competibacteraceae bacterium]